MGVIFETSSAEATFQRGGPEGASAEEQNDCVLVADGVSELDGIAGGYRRRAPSGRSGEAVPRGLLQNTGWLIETSASISRPSGPANPTNDGRAPSRSAASTFNRPMHLSNAIAMGLGPKERQRPQRPGHWRLENWTERKEGGALTSNRRALTPT